MTTFNRECLVAKGASAPFSESDRLRHCTRLRISGQGLGTKIGSGAFGKLYKVKLADGSSVAVKVISAPIEDNLARLISDFHAEVEFTSEMSRRGLGPKVYDAFYSVQNNRVIQNIIMEHFDMSVDSWIASRAFPASPASATKVTADMIGLIHRQVFKYKIFCSDVKPQNFVVKLSGARITEVRMIDFGTDWCDQKIPHIYITDPALRALPRKIQIMSYFIVCLLQLFMTLHMETADSGPKAQRALLKPFFGNRDFVDFAVNDGARHGVSMRLILYDILVTDRNQAKLFRHYVAEKGESVLALVKRVFSTVAEFAQ